jgi:hypothetical protein
MFSACFGSVLFCLRGFLLRGTGVVCAFGFQFVFVGTVVF